MFELVPPEGAPHHPPRLPRPDALPRLPEPGCPLPAPEGVEEFWAGIRRRGTPLVSPDPRGSADHVAVTYLWRGTPPPAPSRSCRTSSATRATPRAT